MNEAKLSSVALDMEMKPESEDPGHFEALCNFYTVCVGKTVLQDLCKT